MSPLGSKKMGRQELLSARCLGAGGPFSESAAVGVFPVDDEMATLPDRPSSMGLGMYGFDHWETRCPPALEALLEPVDVSESQVLQALDGLGS